MRTKTLPAIAPDEDDVAPPPFLVVRRLGKRFGAGCASCIELTGPMAGTSRCRRCGSVVAVWDVDLELGPGEVLGIVGESGSGKTTLLASIELSIQPSAGSIWLADVGELADLADDDRRALRLDSLAMVHQDPVSAGLHPELSAAANVAERLLAAGERRFQPVFDRAQDLLLAMEIDAGRHADSVSAFSGGMRQRVQLARALVRTPRLLLLDEPTTGLDPSVQATLLGLIEQAMDAATGGTLLVSHDLRLVRLLTERVIVLRYGRVVETGLTETVLAAPSHAYTRQLVASQLP